jgi:hypothetical protein
VVERVRMWIQTLALVGVAGALLARAGGLWPEAHADEPAVCAVIGKTFERGDDKRTAAFVQQTEAFIATAGTRTRTIVVPFEAEGPTGYGKAIVCAW